MPTDKQLRDAAVVELKKTTQGYLKSNGQPRATIGAQWKKGLDKLAQIGQAAPPPPGSSLLTREITLPIGGRAYWLKHDSPNTQFDGPASDRYSRIIRWKASPGDADPGLYSGRLMYAVFGFRLTLNGSYPGRMYNWHTQPYDDPWGWTPPCSGGGVSPLAIDYFGDSWGLHVTAEPEASGCSGGSGDYHWTIFTQAQIEALRGRWVWLWMELKWGRSNELPDGACKVWVAGEDTPRVDKTGVNTHYSEQHSVAFWEGQYHSNLANSPKVVEIASTRFGTTPQKAYEDVPVLYASGATDVGGSSVAITPRLSTEAAIPSSLRW